MIAHGAALEVLNEIDSTILEARRRAESGDCGPVWLLALKQTAGRGRRGRAWVSLAGNLFVTYLGAATRKPGEIALLGFAAGLAIAEACEALGAGDVTLKWPNDVLIKGAKVAGVMLDSGASDRYGQWYALAFGVNLVARPAALDQATTALADHVAAPSAIEAFNLIRPRLEHWAAMLTEFGFAPLRAAWRARAYGLGQPVRALLSDETIEGLMQGLSEDGALEIATQAGLRYISAGDVHFPSGGGR